MNKEQKGFFYTTPIREFIAGTVLAGALVTSVGLNYIADRNRVNSWESEVDDVIMAVSNPTNISYQITSRASDIWDTIKAYKAHSGIDFTSIGQNSEVLDRTRKKLLILDSSLH